MRKAVLKVSKRGRPIPWIGRPLLVCGLQPVVDTKYPKQENTRYAGGFDFGEGSVIENG